MLLSFLIHDEKINCILAGVPGCPLCSHTNRVYRPHSPQQHQRVADQLASHLLAPISQFNKQFGFICFDSVLACSYCFSHSCISTRVCDGQKCNSSIRLQGVCWESQVSLRIYVLHQIVVADTILPASKFRNIRISPIPSPRARARAHTPTSPPPPPWKGQIRENKDFSSLP